jgi:alpha-mannosidase
MFYYNEPWHKFLTPERYPKGGKRAKATWFDLSDGKYGLTMAQEGVYAPLFKSGNTFYQLLHLGGTHRFSFRPHAGDWREANAPRFGWERTTPLLVGMADQSESQDAGIPPSQSFLSLGQEHVVLSAFKPALNGQGYVLRCVETQDEDAEVKVRLSSDLGFTVAARATLMEEMQEALTLTDGQFQFPIRGHELGTIYLARTKKHDWMLKSQEDNEQ